MRSNFNKFFFFLAVITEEKMLLTTQMYVFRQILLFCLLLPFYNIHGTKHTILIAAFSQEIINLGIVGKSQCYPSFKWV